MYQTSVRLSRLDNIRVFAFSLPTETSVCPSRMSSLQTQVYLLHYSKHELENGNTATANLNGVELFPKSSGWKVSLSAKRLIYQLITWVTEFTLWSPLTSGKHLSVSRQAFGYLHQKCYCHLRQLTCQTS